MLLVAISVIAISTVTTQLHKFHTQVIVDQEISYTIVCGNFSPACDIDLGKENVILSVAGTRSLHLKVSAGSFQETGLGGYIASVNRGYSKTDILFQPFSGGGWAYSVSIESFAPGSAPINVSLTIGSQVGKTRANVYMF